MPYGMLITFYTYIYIIYIINLSTQLHIITWVTGKQHGTVILMPTLWTLIEAVTAVGRQLITVGQTARSVWSSQIHKHVLSITEIKQM